MYYNFKEEAKKYQVNELSTEELLKYHNGIDPKRYMWGRHATLISTGIYQKRTAHILNFILNSFRHDLAIWIGGYGGGVLIDSETRFVIGRLNEVCLKMNIKYGNKVTNAILFKSKAFGRLKALVKSFVKEQFDDKRKKSINSIDDNGNIINNVTLEELNLLIDFFGYKDLNKKYSKDLIKKVIGEKTMDQFLISATDMMMTEVTNLITKRDDAIRDVEERYQKIREWLNQRSKNHTSKIKDEYDKKISDLNNSLKQMTVNM